MKKKLKERWERRHRKIFFASKPTQCYQLGISSTIGTIYAQLPFSSRLRRFVSCNREERDLLSLFFFGTFAAIIFVCVYERSYIHTVFVVVCRDLSCLPSDSSYSNRTEQKQKPRARILFGSTARKEFISSLDPERDSVFALRFYFYSGRRKKMILVLVLSLSASDKQTNKQTSKQANKQTSKQTYQKAPHLKKSWTDLLHGNNMKPMHQFVIQVLYAVVQSIARSGYCTAVLGDVVCSAVDKNICKVNKGFFFKKKLNRSFCSNC